MRMAVIGCGPMGSLHARKLAGMKDIDLVGVCDHHGVRADILAEELRCDAYHDYWHFIDEVEAVVVATSPTSHGAICDEIIQAHVHVLVEKPITTFEADAKHITRVAEETGIVLQVGHIERFNPVFRRIASVIGHPFKIEVERHCTESDRQIEVDVALDLMIHDIDLVLSMAKPGVSSITASGCRDSAIAELRFPDGSVAILRANRKAATKNRVWSVNDDKHYLLGEYDCLTDELRLFIECIRAGKRPCVGGREATAALSVALEISKQVNHAIRS